ncbi:hypothetical protein Tco_0137759 [Tanacetum coccineum]
MGGLKKIKKRKGKSKSTNGGQFTGPSVKHNVRHEPKATTSAPMKGTTYVGLHLQSTILEKDELKKKNEEEEVENVYDESANLIQNTKAGGSSSFTAAAEPKKVIQALTDPSLIEAMQEELLQFKLQKVNSAATKEEGRRGFEILRSENDLHVMENRDDDEFIEKMN